MESNRNLSSIVDQIRDDGPPAPEPARPVPADSASSVARPGQGRGRRLLRLLVLLLLCTGVMAGAGYYLVRLYGWPPLPVLLQRGIEPEGAVRVTAGEHTPAAPDTVAPRPDRAALDSLDDRIDRLGAQLDELRTTVDDLAISAGKRKAALEETLRTMDDTRQRALERIEARLDALQSRVNGLKPARQADKSPSPAAAPKPAAPAASHAPDKAGSAAPDPADTDSTEEWVVNVASSTVPEKIDEAEAHMHSLGISVERQQVDFGGEIRYRLRVPGFSSSAEARRYATKLAKDLGIKGAWPSRK